MKRLKKVELHLHLDGSVDESLLEQEKKDSSSLSDYLDAFSEPVEYLQTEVNIIKACQKLVCNLKKDNVIYAEVRFAPFKHAKNIKVENVIRAALIGLFDEELKVNLILTMMRGDSFEKNIKLIELAHAFKSNCVVGVDLAGNEKDDLEHYFPLFIKAKSLGVPFTIHAGEKNYPKNILKAVLMGAKRIGHGIASVSSEELLNELKKKQILLEICPTSNLDTKVVNDIKNHPIKRIAQAEVPFSINTDNRTISKTNLSKEYELLLENKLVSKKDLYKSNINAMMSAFLPMDEKLKYLQILIDNIIEIEKV